MTATHLAETTGWLTHAVAGHAPFAEAETTHGIFLCDARNRVLPRDASGAVPSFIVVSVRRILGRAATRSVRAVGVPHRRRRRQRGRWWRPPASNARSNRYHAISGYLQERKSRCQALVAFSGEHEYGGAKVSEASLNGLPSGQIAERFQEDPTASWCARTSSRPATTSRCCTPCTWTRRCPASRRCRPCRASTGRTPRSTTCSCSISQRRRHHPHCVRGLLSGDDPGQRDRPQQAARSAGGPGPRPGLFRGAGQRVRAALPGRGRTRPARSDPGRLRGGLCARAGRGRPSGVQGQRQGLHPHLRLSLIGSPV